MNNSGSDISAMEYKGEVAGSLEEVTPEPTQMAVLGYGMSEPLHGDTSCSGVPSKDNNIDALTP